MSRALNLRFFGLSMALFLALWLVITLAFAMPVRWFAWVGDVVLVGLFGVLLWRGHGRGMAAADGQKAVPTALNPLNIAIFAVVLLIFAVPAVVLPVPLDTDAQGFGYLALTARLSGDLTTLAPLQPEIDYLYAPGFTVIVAYLSERPGTPLHSTQFAAGAVLAWVLVLVLYDFGVLIGGEKRGRAHVLAALVGTGLFSAYMDSHYTSVLGLVFGAAFLAVIYQQTVGSRGMACHAPTNGRALAVMGIIFLAALVLAHPDTTIIIALGYGAWLLLMPLAQTRPTWRQWLTFVFAIPGAALVLILPWLLSVLHLLGSEIASPFSRDPGYWRIVLSHPSELIYHGGVIVLVSMVGAIVGLRARRHEALLAVGWLVLILEFAAFGVLETVAPWLIAPIVRYDYPFSIAWHGPIVPYTLLGGLAFAWLWERVEHARRALPVERLAWIVLSVAAVAIVMGGMFNRQVLAASKGRVTFFGAFASHADVAAMSWLRENTESDAYILNFPGPQEGDWVPVIAERRSVYYRPQPFFQREGDPLADTPEQVALRDFWADPADPENAALLAEFGVAYVIVPQVVGNPDSFAEHFRWRRPFTDVLEMESAVRNADYLEPVFDADGAEVYQFNGGT
ncbi:MAG: hypothetical protein AAF787_08955 [Chloroflexota bacterium]